MKTILVSILILIITNSLFSIYNSTKLYAETAYSNGVTLIQGRVYDKETGANIESKIIYINMKTNDTIQIAKSNSSTGEYTFVANSNANYGLKMILITNDNTIKEVILNIKEDDNYKEIKLDIEVNQNQNCLFN
jgi:primase-polymerase (primpol)-like protein